MRVKSPGRGKHRKLIKAAKGFKQARHIRVRTAKEAILHAGAYAYHGRKLRKRDMRSLWITRLNAAVRPFGVSYSKFVNALKKAKIEIDRKILSDLAIKSPDTFKNIVESVGFKFTPKK